jgi:hypothetical protein
LPGSSVGVPIVGRSGTGGGRITGGCCAAATVFAMPSNRLERVAANRARDAAFFPRVVQKSKCFTWGTDEGVTPWEDRNGDTLLPFWPDEASAFSENQDDVEPGEKVLERPLDELVSSLRRWVDADVGIAVHPENDDIAGTYSVRDFATRLLHAIPADQRESAQWVKDLAGLARVLP